MLAEAQDKNCCRDDHKQDTNRIIFSCYFSFNIDVLAIMLLSVNVQYQCHESSEKQYLLIWNLVIAYLISGILNLWLDAKNK